MHSNHGDALPPPLAVAKCRGCGAALQSRDPALVGFVPEHVLQNVLVATSTHARQKGAADSGKGDRAYRTR